MATAKAVAKRTYEAAVELFAMLCKQYGLNPTADGVIISHKEGHSRGIAINHGDLEHLLTQLGMGYTMDGFRQAVKAAMSGTSSGEYTKIMGTAAATVEQMKAYLKGKNPSVAQSVLDMIPLYLSEGTAEGVRGDIAFAQSCLETGNFTFSGSAVTLDQNNFCGMGVTSNGLKGNSFDNPQLGIRAQIQHLKAYASTENLKNPCIDPRFKYVTRGCAEYVEWLGQQENPTGKGWAAGVGYGAKILSILKAITGTSGGASSPTEVWYRVRKFWADAASQKGAFHSLDNAKRCADENAGYSVFDESGKVLYTSQATMAKMANPDLEVVFPEEGIGFGIMAQFIPANAPNAENAYKFIDYILQPEVAAQCFEYMGYYCTNLDAEQYISEEYRDFLTLPEDIGSGSMEMIENVSAEALEEHQKVWTEFKAACGA